MSLPVIVDSCTGKCCAVFTIPSEAVMQKAIKGDLFFLDMLIELLPEEIGPRLRSLGFAGEGEFPDSYGAEARERLGWWTVWRAFTCRHWNEATRLCGAYEERPGMCRTFPDGKPCHACGSLGAEVRA